MYGLPPHVRGTAVLHAFAVFFGRITPARAGNSHPSPPPTRGGEDHPRACGEQGSWLFRFFRSQGSPPRVRGTEVEPVQVEAAQGITPARAGNRSIPSDKATASKDHPRACGEQAKTSSSVTLNGGSPPRVRGTERGLAFVGEPGRITPARAGNRRIYEYDAGRNEDHPRACGEQAAGTLSQGRAFGSPPRVRGTETTVICSSLPLGITPARAGNRSLSWFAAGLCEDHPRACGEQINESGLYALVLGSPPRVRGTEPHLHGLLRGHGITPARAGNRISGHP